MKRDKGFWTILALYALVAFGINFNVRRLTANNQFGKVHFPERPSADPPETPQRAREFAIAVSEEHAAFSELRVVRLIENSAGPVLSISLVAFLFLAVRQRRFSNRLDALEARKAAEPMK